MVLSIGVYEPGQLRRLHPGTAYGRRRRLALDLLADIEMLDRDIREAYVENICDGIGVFKCTYSGRFLEFDKQILACLVGNHLQKPMCILDSAVSDGSTSIEFF